MVDTQGAYSDILPRQVVLPDLNQTILVMENKTLERLNLESYIDKVVLPYSAYLGHLRG